MGGHLEHNTPLPVAQNQALSLAPIFSGSLSAIGSANIIYMVLREWKTKQTPYRRILLGLSCCDVISSLTFALQAFLLPADTSNKIWAVGNDATCAAMGFFQQLATSAFWYNASLSFYFLIVVKYNSGRGGNLACRRYYEPIMHILSIGYPLVSASIGVGLGVYHEVKVSHGCWINNYPKGCGGCDDDDHHHEAECTPCVHETIAWIFGGIPSLCNVIAVVVNNLLVYCHVRTTVGRSNRYGSNSLSSAQQQSKSMWSTVKNSLRSSGGTQQDTQQRRQSAQDKRVKAVATQAFLYVAAFLLVMAPTITIRLLGAQDMRDEEKVFPLLLFQAIFLPLQGCFNCLIYARPAYMRAREDFPNETKLWAFRRALHGIKVEPRNRKSVTTDGDGKSGGAHAMVVGGDAEASERSVAFPEKEKEKNNIPKPLPTPLADETKDEEVAGHDPLELHNSPPQKDLSHAEAGNMVRFGIDLPSQEESYTGEEEEAADYRQTTEQHVTGHVRLLEDSHDMATTEGEPKSGAHVIVVAEASKKSFTFEKDTPKTPQPPMNKVTDETENEIVGGHGHPFELHQSMPQDLSHTEVGCEMGSAFEEKENPRALLPPENVVANESED